jgi:hypothetical protein
MTYKGLNVIIKRTDNYQYEELTNLKKSVSYTVKWINDCKYTLKPNNDFVNDLFGNRLTFAEVIGYISRKRPLNLSYLHITVVNIRQYLYIN